MWTCQESKTELVICHDSPSKEKQSKSELHVYLGVEDRSSQQRGEKHPNPNSSLIIRTMFSPSFFYFFFLPAWSSSLHITTTAKTHEYRWALAEEVSEWNAPPLFPSLLGCNSRIDGFALLIFGTWIAPLDANGGALKPTDEGVTSAALTWLSLSSGSWFLTGTMTHVTLSHGLHRWKGIHFSNKGRMWLLTCSCTLCVVKIKQDVCAL